jgi:uncharacterized membrane protein
MICPGCGAKVGRKANKIFFVGTITGALFLPMGIATVLQITPDSPDDYVGIAVMTVLPSILLISGIISFFIIKQRKRLHIEYVAKMPPGVIPMEERSGFGNITAKERWKEANIKQRREHAQKLSKRMTGFLTGFVVIGILALLLGIQIDMNINLMMFGSIFLLLGLFFMWLVHYAKKMVERDVPAETKVSWKVVGFETTISAIEEFLRLKSLEFKKEINDWPKNLLYNNPEYKYILSSGNSISTLYSENKDGHVYGWITITYTSLNYLQARDLQRDLDEFLGERDLIRRVA